MGGADFLGALVGGLFETTAVFEAAFFEEFQNLAVPFVVLERVVIGGFDEIREHAVGERHGSDGDGSPTLDSITSRHDLASTVVSVRLAYMFDETITAGIRLSGLSKVNATTEPTSMGNPL